MGVINYTLHHDRQYRPIRITHFGP